MTLRFDDPVPLANAPGLPAIDFFYRLRGVAEERGGAGYAQTSYDPNAEREAILAFAEAYAEATGESLYGEFVEELGGTEDDASEEGQTDPDRKAD